MAESETSEEFYARLARNREERIRQCMDPELKAALIEQHEAWAKTENYFQRLTKTDFCPEFCQ